MAETTLTAQLDQGLAALSLDLDQAARDKLISYLGLLVKWNRVYNLTAVRKPEDMIGLHLLDSLAVLPHLPEAGTLLDVGTGGGLPGIPLAIVRPRLNITLLDSLQKKTTFVRQAAGELTLKNANVVCERVEQYRPPEKFQHIISRAFSALADFVQGVEHLLAPDGTLLAMKGLNPHDEIMNLPPTFVVSKTIKLNVPQVDGSRHLIVLKRGLQ
ncbi:MAG: 16S rRNA (guanine(527)-N(7))-methyltransferase RsmG [Betaproteobacteria bacterium]|nr:16S rRNA (guanine(527)-N(7))-methyltransferase RsmG [Betaproteobacteria bacterium]